MKTNKLTHISFNGDTIAFARVHGNRVHDSISPYSADRLQRVLEQKVADGSFKVWLSCSCPGVVQFCCEDIMN